MWCKVSIARVIASIVRWPLINWIGDQKLRFFYWSKSITVTLFQNTFILYNPCDRTANIHSFHRWLTGWLHSPSATVHILDCFWSNSHINYGQLPKLCTVNKNKKHHRLINKPFRGNLTQASNFIFIKCSRISFSSQEKCHKHEIKMRRE